MVNLTDSGRLLREFCEIVNNVLDRLRIKSYNFPQLRSQFFAYLIVAAGFDGLRAVAFLPFGFILPLTHRPIEIVCSLTILMLCPPPVLPEPARSFRPADSLLDWRGFSL